MTQIKWEMPLWMHKFRTVIGLDGIKPEVIEEAYNSDDESSCCIRTSIDLLQKLHDLKLI